MLTGCIHQIGLTKTLWQILKYSQKLNQIVIPIIFVLPQNLLLQLPKNCWLNYWLRQFTLKYHHYWYSSAINSEKKNSRQFHQRTFSNLFFWWTLRNDFYANFQQPTEISSQMMENCKDSSFMIFKFVRQSWLNKNKKIKIFILCRLGFIHEY